MVVVVVMVMVVVVVVLSIVGSARQSNVDDDVRDLVGQDLAAAEIEGAKDVVELLKTPVLVGRSNPRGPLQSRIQRVAAFESLFREAEARLDTSGFLPVSAGSLPRP